MQKGTCFWFASRCDFSTPEDGKGCWFGSPLFCPVQAQRQSSPEKKTSGSGWLAHCPTCQRSRPPTSSLPELTGQAESRRFVCQMSRNQNLGGVGWGGVGWVHESQSKPIGTKMVVIPEPCTGLRRISAAIYGWDRPLLTFIYPGFEQVAQMVQEPGNQNSSAQNQHLPLQRS